YRGRSALLRTAAAGPCIHADWNNQETPMALTTEEKKAVLAEVGIHETDTGSPAAQIALLTKRSGGLTAHPQTHQHDHHSRRGLLLLVGRRRRLLKYIASADIERYRSLIGRLGLRRCREPHGHHVDPRLRSTAAGHPAISHPTHRLDVTGDSV